MKIICIQCHREFEATRKTAKFCSPACRLASHREVPPEVKGPEYTPVKEWKPLKVKKVLEAPIKVCSPEADSTAEERAAFVKCLDNYIKPV